MSFICVRSLYTKILESAQTPWAFSVYCVVAFLESSIFPIPPDLIMIPMILANRQIAWRLASWGVLASVVGGFLGYFIGYSLYNSLGSWIIVKYGLQDSFVRFQDGFHEWGFWIIALKGLTPIPYKLVTIASGVAHFPLIPFLGASIIARGFRFFLLAGLLWRFGPIIKPLFDKYINLFLFISLAIIGLGFFLIKFLP